MKKFGFVLAMLAVALVLGLVFVGCKTEVEEVVEVPEITRFNSAFIGSDAGGTYTTGSFTVTQRIGFILTKSAPYHDLAYSYFTINKAGVSEWEDETVLYLTHEFPEIQKKGEIDITTTYPFEVGTFEIGLYIAEVYVEDVEGNKSNIMTTYFGVQ